MPLEDYKDIVGMAAGIAGIAQMFSGVFVCKDIVQQGSTKNVSVIPFLGGTAMCVISFKYAEILQDDVMLKVNIAGLVLSASYMLVYYMYCLKKDELWSQIFKASAVTGLILAYSMWEDPVKVEFWLGMILTAFIFILVASPLLSLGEVVRTKSTVTLPFPMILSGTVVSFLWLLYGIIIKNVFIQVQNVVAFGLSAMQLMLFVIYPKHPVDVKKDS